MSADLKSLAAIEHARAVADLLAARRATAFWAEAWRNSPQDAFRIEQRRAEAAEQTTLARVRFWAELKTPVDTPLRVFGLVVDRKGAVNGFTFDGLSLEAWTPPTDATPQPEQG